MVEKPCRHGPYPCSNKQDPCPVKEKKLSYPIELAAEIIEVPIVGMTQKAPYKLQACVEHIGGDVHGGIYKNILQNSPNFKNTFNFTF